MTTTTTQCAVRGTSPADGQACGSAGESHLCASATAAVGRRGAAPHGAVEELLRAVDAAAVEQGFSGVEQLAENLVSTAGQSGGAAATFVVVVFDNGSGGSSVVGAV